MNLDVRSRIDSLRDISLQPLPAVSCKCVFSMCRRPPGLRFTMGYPTVCTNKPPDSIWSQLCFRASQSLPGETPVSLPAPGPEPTSLWSVWSIGSYPVDCMLHQTCAGDLVHKWTIYHHRKGKRNTGQTLKWEQDNVTKFKNTVWYVTLYHYKGPLKASPKHLAYVWTWNWIHLCGNSNKHLTTEEQAESILYR